MPITTTPAPSQTIKGIDEFTSEKQSVYTDSAGKMQITNPSIEEILKDILGEIRLMRYHIETITDEHISLGDIE